MLRTPELARVPVSTSPTNTAHGEALTTYYPSPELVRSLPDPRKTTDFGQNALGTNDVGSSVQFPESEHFPRAC